MKVLLLGATGLVGREVLKLLVQDESIDGINILSRRSTSFGHPKIQEFIGPLNEMDKYKEAFQIDAVLCCLGTTIKKAGCQEKFREVDYVFPLNAAKIAKENNVSTFGIITSLGANSKSKIFYPRVKGELEEQLSELSFENLYFIRPSILVGERKESRPAETLGILIAKFSSPLFVGPLKKYAGSKVEDVARLLVDLVTKREVTSSLEYEVKSEL